MLITVSQCFPEPKPACKYLLDTASRKLAKKAPWNNIQCSHSKYFDTSMIPDGVTLRDPSKMNWIECNALLEHWHTQQSNAMVPFKFQRVVLRGNLVAAIYPVETQVPLEGTAFPANIPKRKKPRKVTMVLSDSSSNTSSIVKRVTQIASELADLPQCDGLDFNVHAGETGFS